ncbi:MAG TPA: glycosyltransferase [Opitutus sp.]|nr:glycosyltransferase [Opitutus sp.]
MNILFVNYGDFTSNSLNHIGAFANQLTLLGHSCVVAVPDNPETISAIPEPLFTPLTFERALQREPIFPDRRPADVVHAWTPRENVREFCLHYLRQHREAALIVHLEDNEAFLIESFAQEGLDRLRTLSDEELAARLSPRLSHPVRFKNFLRVAHAATFITDRLREFIPADKPAVRLLPGIDPASFEQPVPTAPTRESFGVQPHEKLLVFTGSTTFANLADVRTLLLAVRLLNDRGTPCKLLRTGINPPQYSAELAAIAGSHVIDLGFVEKPLLPHLLALADVLVQPGAADAFNDYRLPSKIPEFLSSGRPTIIPRANLAHEMQDGRDALLLDTGTPEEIAEKCLRVFQDPVLAGQLAEGARAFARRHFDLKENTAVLLSFYQRVAGSVVPLFADPSTPPSEDVLLASGELALRMRAKELTIAHLREQATAAEKPFLSLKDELALHQRTIHSLQSTVAGLNETIDSLRHTLSGLQASHDLQVARYNYQTAKTNEARNQVEVLRGQLVEAMSAVRRFADQLEAQRARSDELSAELHQSHQKTKRLQRSFSWQITAPLRSLRRLLIDPLTRRRPAPAPRPISPDTSLTCVIDEPTDWNQVAPTGTLRGWVLSQENLAVLGVRLRAAGHVFDAAHALTRPDVAMGHPAHPHALRSGFSLEYSLPPQTSQPLLLEVQTEDRVWRCAATPTAQVAAEIPPHLRRDYATWVQRFDTLGLEQTVALRARVESLPDTRRPLISVLMPTYNTPEVWLIKAIESVRAQIYPHWELCIADDASTSPHVRRVLEDYARRDERIKVTFREQNGHISAASNSALALARGEFTALLDHDDELTPQALAEVAFALAANPALEFLYSDEDKIDEQGRRFEPYFKPDWNPDLLLGQNYICHLSVFRTSRLHAIGGFRVGYEGSQDWDLTLRFAEGLSAGEVHHIPRILYHWRAIAGSTALVIDQKSDYPFLAARKALADHLARTGTAAELVSVTGRHWRVKRALPEPAPRVSIIIPTRNAEGLLRICIGSILARTAYPDFEVIVANNRSDDPGTLAYFDELRRIKVRVIDYDQPFNFSAINNFAARAATGSVLAFLNNDLEVITPDWLAEMTAQALRPEIGCVGAMLYYPNETVQHAGVVLGLTGPAGKDGVAGHAFKGFPRGAEGQRNRLRLVQNYSAVTAACLVVRREVFDQVGGFNEADLPVAFNDIDFCLRVRQAGYRNLWTPFAELYHHESASRGAEDTPEKIARFQREAAYMRHTWGALLDNDPAYNPNLTLQHEDFALAFPPRAPAT